MQGFEVSASLQMGLGVLMQGFEVSVFGYAQLPARGSLM